VVSFRTRSARGVNGDEGSGENSFAEKILEEIGDANGGLEGGLEGGGIAEVVGEDTVAGK
jgi:hypothetical protein